jgi:hypothetical protein
MCKFFCLLMCTAVSGSVQSTCVHRLYTVYTLNTMYIYKMRQWFQSLINARFHRDVIILREGYTYTQWTLRKTQKNPWWGILIEPVKTRIKPLLTSMKPGQSYFLNPRGGLSFLFQHSTVPVCNPRKIQLFSVRRMDRKNDSAPILQLKNAKS